MDDIEKSDIKSIFQIVNVLNNEKISFADKVILVEGVADRIIYERVLKTLQRIKGNSEEIEIVVVYGKDNFEKFKEFLKSWRIKNYIIDDFDYLETVGCEEIIKLFKVGYGKMKKSLNNDKSKDAKALLESLNKIIVKKKDEIIDEDFQNMSNLYKYLKNRSISLKGNISSKEKAKIEGYINNQYKDNIFVLKNGNIEDYFGGGHFDIEKAIETGQNINQDNMPEEFKEVFTMILDD
jgi:predicted ATP-dependent endonuclease of OLD family